jgi:hypothetical protein
VVSASHDPRAWPQPRPRKVASASPDTRARLNLSLGRNRVLARPRPRPREKSPPRLTLGSDRPCHGGYIITLPLASSGYGEQDRCPTWLAPVASNDGSPRASMTMAVLSPLRKQGDVSKIPAAPTAVLLQGSGTSSTATLACTQGLGTTLPDMLAHSYSPHCTPGLSPCIYKREVQGLHAGGSRGRTC